MRLSLGRSALVAAAVCAAVATGVVLSPPAGPAIAQTAEFGQTSTVGALFTLTPSGQLGTHFCTASVVDSPRGDLILTAAHCMANRQERQVAFVPDYDQGQAPFGIWTVRDVITDANWVSASDPDDDYAFLIVHRAGSKTPLQSLTGGEVVGVDIPAGRVVKVAGYPDGTDALISCQNTAEAFSPTQYQFDCGGFTDGTSGSPLLADVGPLPGADTVIGVIGGYEQGGDTDSVSYAARFSTRLSQLYQTALAAARR